MVTESQEIACKPEGYNVYQDVLTQFPFLNGYTHFLRGFQAPPNTAQDHVVASIQVALDELRAKIPWLGHQVVHLDVEPGSSGFITNRPWPASAPPNNVTCTDKAGVLPSLSSLVASECPMSSLVPEHLECCPGLPHPHGLSPAPVMMVRAVFIEGGVLIVISTHHNMIDGLGQMQIWDHLATLMSGGELSDEAVEVANRDRACVVPLLRPDEPARDYSHLLRPNPWPLGPPPSTEWMVFTLTRNSLEEIQTRAGAASPDDALSAFCWQRICAVRVGSGRCRPEQISKFGRAIDARRAVGLPPAWLGHSIVHAATKLPMGKVAETPLADLAGQLRLDLDEARSEWAVRSCATFMAQFRDKSKLLYGGLYNPETDVGGTSFMFWAKKPSYRMGLLGQSKFFRKPDGPSIPGCMYFFPSDVEGQLQIVLCMTKNDLNGLCDDPWWSRYIRRVGSSLVESK
jgi:trichothecene 3-O-acetyltransferase